MCFCHVFSPKTPLMRHLHNPRYEATPQSPYPKIIYLAEIDLFFHICVVSVLFTNHYLHFCRSHITHGWCRVY